MADDSLGSAWYELGLRDTEFRSGVRRAEEQLRSTARAGSEAFASSIEGGTRRAGRSVDGFASKINSLRGRGPDEVARALDRAAREADEATAAVRKLGDTEIDHKKARAYADQLNEISIEADQVLADLRELQAADPRFNTPELQRTATELDRIGREAGEAAGQLNTMKGVGADTHLERMAQKANDAATGLGRADKAADGFSTRLTTVRNLLASAGIVIGLHQAVRYLGEANEAAVELDARQRGATRVLGEHIDVLHEFAESSAESWGLARREVYQTGAVLHAQLENLGFDSRAAAAEVVELLQRSADMAATFGGPTADAVLAISAVLRGERDTIEKYGVSLKEADVNARILALGLDQSTSDARKNAVAIASLDLVMEQTRDSAGAFAESIGTAWGEGARLNAEMENLNAEVGTRLQPTIMAFQRFLRDEGIPTLEQLMELLNFEERGETDLPVLQQIEELLNFIAGGSGAGDLLFPARDIMRRGTRLLIEGAKEAEVVWKGLKTTLPGALEDAKEPVDRAASELAAIPRQRFESQAAALRQAGYDSVVEFAAGALDAQNEPADAFEAAMELLNEEMTREQEIAELQGQMTTLAHARGIAFEEGKDDSVIAIDAALQVIRDRLLELTKDAYAYGEETTRQLGLGMKAAGPVAQLTEDARVAANAVRRQIGIESEPEDPNSPLHGITEWGGNIDRTIASDMLAFANRDAVIEAARTVANDIKRTYFGLLYMTERKHGLDYWAVFQDDVVLDPSQIRDLRGQIAHPKVVGWELNEKPWPMPGANPDEAGQPPYHPEPTTPRFGSDVVVNQTLNVQGLVRAETPVDIGIQARRGVVLGIRAVHGGSGGARPE